MIDISDIALLTVPMFTTVVRNKIQINQDRLCWLTKFTFNSMFPFFAVIFSVMITDNTLEVYKFSKYEMKSTNMLVIFFCAAGFLTLFNLVSINHISVKFFRQLVSLIIWIATVALLLLIIFKDIFFA